MTDELHARPEIVEVTEPLGPGLDFEPVEGGRHLMATRARSRGPWFGLDRAEVVDSDDGSGRGVRVLLGVPTSTFSGCRVRVTWTGGLVDDRGPILVGRVHGVPDPIPAAVRTVAGVRDGSWIDAADATRIAAEGRRRYRTRRAAERIVGGRAWEPQLGTIEDARFTTAHARSEYTLGGLPPRYLRGLRQLLDPDERVLYAIERPAINSLGFAERIARRADRRAALLVLTDRQIAWMVDHADPDRFLSDWGVDVELIPAECLTGVEVRVESRGVRMVLATGRGTTSIVLPAEYAAEARVAAGLAGRFAPPVDGRLPRRTHPVEAAEPDWTRPATFGQEAEARSLFGRVPAGAVATLYSPRRPGQRTPVLWSLAGDEVICVAAGDITRTALAEIHALRLVLSPLSGRLELVGPAGRHLAYPAPFGEVAAALVRAIRRRTADGA